MIELVDMSRRAILGSVSRLWTCHLKRAGSGFRVLFCDLTEGICTQILVWWRFFVWEVTPSRKNLTPSPVSEVSYRTPSSRGGAYGFLHTLGFSDQSSMFAPPVVPQLRRQSFSIAQWLFWLILQLFLIAFDFLRLRCQSFPVARCCFPIALAAVSDCSVTFSDCSVSHFGCLATFLIALAVVLDCWTNYFIC